MTAKLRVWWIPQVPGEPFRVEVESLREARLVIATLTDYDIFQYDQKIKPDYCNVGGLETLESEEWGEWLCEECDSTIDYCECEEDCTPLAACEAALAVWDENDGNEHAGKLLRAAVKEAALKFRVK